MTTNVSVHNDKTDSVLDERLRAPWTVTDELARLVAAEHRRDPRTNRCAGCGYRPSGQFPRCRSHVVARAVDRHSAVTDLPPAQGRPAPARTTKPAGVDQLVRFPARVVGRV
jgi:hypothetical protein